MSRKTVELPAERLAIGMYVANLDRPWVETPFLFQGFAIREQDEIKQLQQLCKVVSVDVTTPEAAEAVRRANEAAKAAKPEPKPENAGQSIERGDAEADAQAASRSRRDPLTLRAELKAARAVHANANRVVIDMIGQLREGRPLAVPEVAAVVESMVESVLRNREALMWLNRIRAKDEYVYSHSLGTAVWALALGRHLNLDRATLKAIGLGAMLLDVGKTRVTTELLQKTGALSPEEHAELRRHVEYGLEIVNAAPGVDANVITMIRAHHERFDGKGYPNGVAGEDIPLVGRIGAIVDCYDAMISVRAYAKQVSTYDAIRELNRLAGTSFHPEMVEQLIQAIGVFPTGTLVQLNTGEVGVVTGQSPFRRMRPEVMLLLDAQKQLRTEFTTIDLQSQQNGASGPEVWIERGLEPGAFGLDPTEYFL